MIEVMRGEGAPPTAVRAVVAGALCYLDAELLNALVLRRDCCSVSAVKALQVRNCSSSPDLTPLLCWSCATLTQICSTHWPPAAAVYLVLFVCDVFPWVFAVTLPVQI